MKTAAWMILAVSLSSNAVRAGETNRFNLCEAAPPSRFRVAEPSWPQEIGQVELCLWRDDKLAAFSIGVDDNFGTEIDWWKAQAEKYDLRVTWFLISGRVGFGSAMWGSWEQFRELESLGHAVESHTVTHLHTEQPGWGTEGWNYLGSRVPGTENFGDPTPEEAARGIAWEYAASKALIERSIPGKKVSALAYPGGKASKLNDRQVAAKLYRLGRAASGRCNPADATDYLGVIAMSSWTFEPGTAACLSNILDRSLYRGLYYRGWAVVFTHSALAVEERMKATFEFIQANRDHLWVGLFTEVGKYGQERDTATLVVESVESRRITFRLSDEMDDSYFDFPLTVKVRVPAEWGGLEAMQNGTLVHCVRVEHDGGAFALVEAVPDRGSVTVQAE